MGLFFCERKAGFFTELPPVDYLRGLHTALPLREARQERCKR